MTIPVWIPRKYDSRFSLLGAMADELAIAFDAKGYEVIDGMPDGSRVGIYIFFNRFNIRNKNRSLPYRRK